MLCRSTFRLSELNAFSASTSNIASVSSSWKILDMAWTAASHPPGRPAQSCKLPALSMISGFTTETIAFPTICLRISPTPIGLTPGFLSRDIKRQAMYASRDELRSGWTTMSQFWQNLLWLYRVLCQLCQNSLKLECVANHLHPYPKAHMILWCVVLPNESDFRPGY